MSYEEFEWHILRLVYEEGLDRLRPSYLAYALGLPHHQVSEFLEQAAGAGILEMEVFDDGRIEYTVPGLDRAEQLPSPIWAEVREQIDENAPSDSHDHPQQPAAGDDPPAKPPPDKAPPPSHQQKAPAAGAAPPAEPPARARLEHQREDEPASERLAVAQHPQLPSSIRRHIEARYSTAENAMVPFDNSSPIVSTDASVDDPTSRTMSALDADEFPFRVETSDDTYCDPTQTVFMRQIRVHGVDSEQELRHHVERLFESFGYRIVQAEEDRLRFERGSVTFILALVPLFVLVLPLFVYLFLYCMGRSTIHQEPVELDVQFRRQIEDGEPVYEIDLTFIGLHGVVLGAADQRVLNQEIDTLRDELRWSLSPG